MNEVRKVLKRLFFGAALVLTLPAVLLVRLEQVIGVSEAVFVFFAQLLAVVPGKPGNYLRSAFYFGTLTECSWEIDIGFGTHFTHRDCRLAAHVSTGSYCVIGHVSIDRNVRLASRVSIPSGKRQHLDRDGNLSEGTTFDVVSIGRDTWVGEGAVVMAEVGSACIVSAGAVVLNAVPSTSVVGGNPARVLKSLPEKQAASETV